MCIRLFTPPGIPHHRMCPGSSDLPLCLYHTDQLYGCNSDADYNRLKTFQPGQAACRNRSGKLD